MSFVESGKFVFCVAYILLLPGFLITHIFFPKQRIHSVFDYEKKIFVSEREGIDFVERIALSLVLSIAVVPLIMFYLYLIGMKVNIINVLFVTTGLIIILLLILFFIMRKK